LFIIFSCANFEKNVDRENYEIHINAIRNIDIFQNSLENLILLRIEPTFIFITYIINLFTEFNFFIYLIYAFIALASKAYSARVFEKYSFFFLSIYLLFFSPSLEFASIRIAASLGLMFLAIYYEIKGKHWLKLFLFLLSFFFHYSSLVFLLPYFLLSKIKISNTILTLVFFVPLFFSNIIIYLISGYDRVSNYDGNVGSIYSFIYPLLFLFIQLLFLIFNSNELKNAPSFILKLVLVELALSGLSIGVCLKFVIFSYRILEIQSFFYLIILFYFISIKKSLSRKSVYISLLVLILTLISIKLITEGIWKILI
jgi:hypothetical protein